MKRLRDKLKRIRMMRWSRLTLSEKIAKVIITLLKIAVIIAVVVAIASAVFAVAMGVVIASCIASAIAGGFDYVGYNERFVRFK